MVLVNALVPAYPASIHKSQGSEYPEAVVIPVMTQRHAMLQRNLLYTGVTRGKRLVVLVGQKKAVAIAVRNVSGRRRWSKLAEWLSADVSNMMSGVTVPAMAVAGLFGEQEVRNKSIASFQACMHQRGPYTPSCRCIPAAQRTAASGHQRK
jgi:hypothetical protein